MIVPGGLYRIHCSFNSSSNDDVDEFCIKDKLILVTAVEEYELYRTARSVYIEFVSIHDGGYVTFIYEGRLLQTLFLEFKNWLKDV